MNEKLHEKKGQSNGRLVNDPEGEGKTISPDAYKTFDIKKAVRQDVSAAVSLLSLILDNPAIMDLVVGEIEKIRAKIVEQEGLPKREDFHPELKPEK